MIEAKPHGIFDLLDEESKLPKSNSEHFTMSVHENYGSHFRLMVLSIFLDPVILQISPLKYEQ